MPRRTASISNVRMRAGLLARSLVPGLLSTSSSDPAAKLVRSEISPLLRLAGLLGLRLWSALIDLDGRKAALGGAQREWCVVLLTTPDRQRAGGADLLDQTFGQELVDELLGHSALQVRDKLDAAILALGGGG
jgi:hypothetical protein